ncbi:MAG: cupredoxin domain-containing protein [Methylococcaceae bacterium]
MLNPISLLIAGGLLISPLAALAVSDQREIIEHNQFMDHGDGHLMDMDGGMVMGQNKDKLPAGCDRVSEDAEITVHAGHQYARNYPGTMFGFDKHEWKVKPCTRLTVHFINEDNIRHQWMMHGLPKFMYDKGMFHLEVTGPAKISGTLILPKEDRTYLVHCDMAQHMEKGMKGQLVVGNGSTPFPSIPGVTEKVIADDYSGAKPMAASSEPRPMTQPTASVPPLPLTATAEATKTSVDSSSGSYLFGVLLGALGTPWVIGGYRKRFQGMTQREVLEYLWVRSRHAFNLSLAWLQTLYSQFTHKS